MNKAEDDTKEQMRRAVTAYTGPVTRCPPGKARAQAAKVLVMNRSVEWLKQNRRAQPIRDKKIVRRRIRMSRAQQQRIAKRNATILKQINSKSDDEFGQGSDRCDSGCPLRNKK